MIYTSYFAQIPKIKSANPDKIIHFINIARSKPKWVEDTIIDIPDLYPDWEIVRDYKERLISQAKYTNMYYRNTLTKVNPEKILTYLNTLEGVVVLLCYEKSQDFCHRHLVAQWIQDNTGQEITEWI